jgi:hypothetical protein
MTFKLTHLFTLASVAFLASCSGDDEATGTFSCDMKVSTEIMGEPYNTHTCGEAAASDVTDEERSQCKSNETYGVTAVAGSACPAGFVKTCPGTRNGKSITHYYYDAAHAEMSCEELTAEMGE